jgi:hypothetical protein
MVTDFELKTNCSLKTQVISKTSLKSVIVRSLITFWFKILTKTNLFLTTRQHFGLLLRVVKRRLEKFIKRSKFGGHPSQKLFISGRSSLGDYSYPFRDHHSQQLFFLGRGGLSDHPSPILLILIVCLFLGRAAGV